MLTSKRFIKVLLLITLLFALSAPEVFANPPTPATTPDAKSIVVDDVKKCKSEGGVTPSNCLFLEEPIGGTVGTDLFIRVCYRQNDKTYCEVKLWSGTQADLQSKPDGSVIAHGPLQAILSNKPGEEGSLGLLYGYLAIVYKYVSGLILGVAVLTVIVGGIMMSTAYGNQEKFGKGRDLIIKALVGMAMWFLASLILYTINPTFFEL
jgi:hypothetical protein